MSFSIPGVCGGDDTNLIQTHTNRTTSSSAFTLPTSEMCSIFQVFCSQLCLWELKDSDRRIHERGLYSLQDMANTEVGNTEATRNVSPYPSREASAGLPTFRLHFISCKLNIINTIRGFPLFLLCTRDRAYKAGSGRTIVK